MKKVTININFRNHKMTKTYEDTNPQDYEVADNAYISALDFIAECIKADPADFDDILKDLDYDYSIEEEEN